MRSTELFDLRGKVAFVTGGYGMFGRPISEALLEAGAGVVIAARDTGKAIGAADEMANRGLMADVIRLDLADPDSIRSTIQAIIAQYGRIDILVNNAVASQGSTLEETTIEDWEATQRVNSTGLFLTCKEVVPHMRAQGGGNIINIASIQGEIGPSFHMYKGTERSSPLHYTFEKWSMVGMTKYLANHYGAYGIRVNCISPGGIDHGQPETILSNYKKHTPLNRMAEPLDVKGPIVFMASEASRYITGHNLLVDGGWTSW